MRSEGVFLFAVLTVGLIIHLLFHDNDERALWHPKKYIVQEVALSTVQGEPTLLFKAFNEAGSLETVYVDPRKLRMGLDTGFGGTYLKIYEGQWTPELIFGDAKQAEEWEQYLCEFQPALRARVQAQYVAPPVKNK